MVCYVFLFLLFFFFFKQKTAYEMRISDWSSDVCSSDLDFAPSLVGEYRYDRSVTDQTPNWDQLYHVDSNLGYPGFDGYASHERPKHADLDAPMYEKSKISGLAFTLSWNLDDVNKFKRSEERRAGKEGVGQCRSRWSPIH